MRKRVFCLFLCMLMCFTLLPAWASAEGEQQEEDIVVETETPAQEPALEEEVVVEEEVVEENPDSESGYVIEENSSEVETRSADSAPDRNTADVTVDPALNLHDTIGVKFYIIPSEGVNPQELTVNVFYSSKYQTINKDFPLADMSCNAAGEYKITAIDAASDEMSDVVTLTIYQGSTEIFHQDYTIASIANTWLENERMQDYWPLLRAMLQYGDKAQGFFNNHPETHITPADAPALVTIPASFAPGADSTALADYIEYCQFSIDLETAVGMNVYIKPKAGHGIDDIAVRVSDRAGSAVATTAPAMVNGEIKISIPGLYPEQLLDNYIVTVTVNDESATYVRSVIGCAYVLEQKAKAVELVESLYQYSLCAQQIFPDPTGPEITAFTIGDLVFEVNGTGTCRVKSYGGHAASVTVPETIPSNDSSILPMFWGVVVTEIGPQAFADNTEIASIDLPDTVQLIAARAFAGCSDLNSMN